MLSFQIITLLLIILINLVVVWIISSQSWRVRINRYFVLAVVFVIFWAIGSILLIAGSNESMVALGRLLFLIAPMYTIFFLSMFAAVFPKENGVSLTIFNLFLGVLTFVFSLYILYDPSQFVPISLLQSGNSHFVVNPFWYTVYTAYFNVAYFITFGEFFRNIRTSRIKAHRQQALYVFTGTLITAVLALVTNLMLPVFGIGDFIWLGPSWTLFYVLTVSISIVKHQLFDIKLAAVRTIAYAGALLTLSGVYYVFAYVLSVLLFSGQGTDSISVNPINILLALILAFLFQPIKRFFDRITNNIFYRDRYNSDTFFAELGRLLTSTTDLRGLLERSSKEIARTFKAEQAFFLLYYRNDSRHHMSAGTHRHAILPIDDARVLDSYIHDSGATIILTEELQSVPSVRRMLVSHKIALVIPLQQDDQLIGHVLLGDSLRGGYSKRDMLVLSTIRDELVIAIQNAFSLHELKELNATLQQRIDVATKELRSSNAQLKHLDEVKDEFMSMASHQLRTPLTSIKGYLSMVIEGDAGAVSPQQHKLLIEAFNSSERMVRLIADFLNVSRLQTGKFIVDKAPVDMKDIVRDEVKDLELIAVSHNMKLRLNVGKQPMPVFADEGKIRQVVMNFIDNAIYYSHQKSTIVINLERVKNEVALTVVDTGIGVPEEEQAKLFTKFFRAGNARKARPDGTGVGLFLARRVITAHGGAIIFSSKEGKGSTFGFRLPIDTNPKHATVKEPEESVAVS